MPGAFCIAAALLVGAGLLPPGPAAAADGVLEINHACATQGGCFPGDTTGYPVTINGSAGRSYRLTSDLVVPSEYDTGILISAPGVSIDLGGFEIVRAGCVGATAACTPATGFGSGIERTAYYLRGISVRNGSIAGMGSVGVRVGEQAEVSNLRVRWNRTAGIDAGSGSTIANNTAYENASYGIYIGPGSTVSGNTAHSNAGDGIRVSFGSTVSGNTAFDNGGEGIGAGSGSTVSGSTAFSNGGDGIGVGLDSTVASSTAYANGDDGISAGDGSNVSGNTASSNAGDGIQTSSGCNVQRNSLRANTGFGLRLFGQSAYRENTVAGNVGGTVTGGLNMGSNSCNGTTTCP